MVKHNNEVPHQHFKKDWQNRVRTWFDQPGSKKRRRLTRQKKAARVAPRPAAGALRPVVRCQTPHHNTRVRYGRGFTLEELRAAGVNAKVAPTIGIAVDHRRRNRSEESLSANVARLKEYMSRLVVFPRRRNKPRQGDETDPARLAAAKQQQLQGEIIPIERDTAVLVGERAVTEEDRAYYAYRTLRTERTNKRYHGIREKRAAEKAREEEEKKK